MHDDITCDAAGSLAHRPDVLTTDCTPRTGDLHVLPAAFFCSLNAHNEPRAAGGMIARTVGRVDSIVLLCSFRHMPGSRNYCQKVSCHDEEPGEIDSE